MQEPVSFYGRESLRLVLLKELLDAVVPSAASTKSLELVKVATAVLVMPADPPQDTEFDALMKAERKKLPVFLDIEPLSGKMMVQEDEVIKTIDDIGRLRSAHSPMRISRHAGPLTVVLKDGNKNACSQAILPRVCVRQKLYAMKDGQPEAVSGYNHVAPFHKCAIVTRCCIFTSLIAETMAFISRTSTAPAPACTGLMPVLITAAQLSSGWSMQSCLQPRSR